MTAIDGSDVMPEARWELMGDPLGRLVVVGGTDPTGLDVGQTVWVVPEAEVERLREALREYGDHQSWRCEHAPHFYLADPADAKAITDRGDCFCGLDATLRDLGLLDITALPPD